ncbi:uncharacterized protein F4812DRAFT_60250 [Daldinia caldariorum]|uniref:uncharacterized protein n=1 Tax=Daldinia caldariorum TaxID=326644 RepID=UPI0020087C3F|nr:uncharacterized protein F4812DRAFT_60250 [Daldinia caldariorum]KAI1466635.1 hypothetical protein F4812DRAFT_60250 [Daldinia caldariorum]
MGSSLSPSKTTRGERSKASQDITTMAPYDFRQAGYSQHDQPVYMACPCGGQLQTSSLPYGHPIAFCTACGTQAPAYFPNVPNNTPYFSPVPQTPTAQVPYNTASLTGTFYMNNVPYPIEPRPYGWNSPTQCFQQPSQPPPASYTYDSPTTYEPYGTRQSGGSQFYTNPYLNGLEVPRGGITLGQQWYASPSEIISSLPPGRRSTPIPYAPIPDTTRSPGRRQQRRRPASDSIRHAFPSRRGNGRRPALAEIHRKVPEQEEAEMGREEVEDDEHGKQPLAFSERGEIILVGESWTVPSRDEAIKEAGQAMGKCDITSVHETVDEDGTVTELEIRETNCEEELVMSGGLPAWSGRW